MIHVTRPSLPPLSELIPLLEKLWDSRILSNGGEFHIELERRLSDYLGLEHVSLFCNATIALMVAQQALEVKGEVITTPYSFAATAHSIKWAGNVPVFCDIERKTLGLDPKEVQEAITEKTSALLPLHCYGNNCDVEALSRIAEKHGLSMIYDACHSFGVTDSGGSTLRYGDMSVVSFHATKVFNTFEGGLLVCSSAEQKQRVDRLKNFGFVSETEVIDVGINGKMSEFNAALGLLQLEHLDEKLADRCRIDEHYRSLLSNIEGVTMLTFENLEKRNFAYFPIFVDSTFPVSRDELYDWLKAHDIHARRYFYPIIPEYAAYKEHNDKDLRPLPVAELVAQQVLCLPMFPGLGEHQVRTIVDLIKSVR